MKRRFLVYVVGPHGATADVYRWARRLERRPSAREWFMCCHPEELEVHIADCADSAHYVFWNLGTLAYGVPQGISASLVYAEAQGEQSMVLLPHREHFLRAVALSSVLHRFVVHTPWMAAELEQHGLRTAVAPVGWMPEAIRDVNMRKKIVFFGSITGKRTWLMPYLFEELGDVLEDLSGNFGAELTCRIAGAHAVLDVRHSDVLSSSTWRMWQAVASSTPLITEQGGGLGNPHAPDLFPLNEKAYVTLPPVAVANMTITAGRLRTILDTDLSSVEREMALQAGAHTFETCARNLLTELNGGVT